MHLHLEPAPGVEHRHVAKHAHGIVGRSGAGVSVEQDLGKGGGQLLSA